MSEIDSYLTIIDSSKAEFSEKRSKFLAFAHHVDNVDDVKNIVQKYEQEYYDARHVCYAYMLGYLHDNFRANDNGEPSGTAGKPILGQINSNNLTNILIVVVRYFGGIKLGTSGLIQAYKEAASLVIANSQIIAKTVDDVICVQFEYPLMNQVMRVAKEDEVSIIEQDFQIDCKLKLKTRRRLAGRITDMMNSIYGVKARIMKEEE